MVDRATGGAHDLHAERRRHGRARAQHLPLHARAARVHATASTRQAEYGARLMADAILDTWRTSSSGTPERPGPVRAVRRLARRSRWRTAGSPARSRTPIPASPTAAPTRRSTATRSSRSSACPTARTRSACCRASPASSGCRDRPTRPACRSTRASRTDDFQSRGIPLPENYSAPSYTGLAEDVSVHLQAFRLGDILFTVCSCEQWKDQSLRHQDAHRHGAGQPVHRLRLGLALHLRRRHGRDVDLPGPAEPLDQPAADPDQNFLRMKAQVNNDADGWNDLSNLLWAESEPTDTTQIKGNYTHDELPPELGYRLTVPISMANDYNGYIATYREYQRGDHYRKALTAWGPHSSDYLASRLVAMGGHLNGGPGPARGGRAGEGHRRRRAERPARRQARARSARHERDGLRGGAARRRRDGASARAAAATCERFAAAFFKWNGGSNFTDNPRVEVQRLEAARWTHYAGQSGEMPVTLEFPQGQDAQSYLEGGQRVALDRALRGLRGQLRHDRGVARDPRGHLPLRGRRPAPRGRHAGALPPRVANRSGSSRGTASRSRTCAPSAPGASASRSARAAS